MPLAGQVGRNRSLDWGPLAHARGSDLAAGRAATVREWTSSDLAAGRAATVREWTSSDPAAGRAATVREWTSSDPAAGRAATVRERTSSDPAAGGVRWLTRAAPVWLPAVRLLTRAAPVWLPAVRLLTRAAPVWLPAIRLLTRAAPSLASGGAATVREGHTQLLQPARRTVTKRVCAPRGLPQARTAFGPTVGDPAAAPGRGVRCRR
jgi:hypothetical protein